MGAIARDFHDTIVWIPEGVSIWSPLESGSRRSFLCVPSNRYTQNCAQVPYRFKGHKSAGMCAVAADFHDTSQSIHHKFSCIRPVFFTDPHFEGWWKRIKTVFVTLIESPYTTLYQTVRTCHDISSDEVAWTDSIKKGVPNFGEM